jgi:UDP-2,3-diacylglucosamine pyrophosphatase LpxH
MCRVESPDEIFVISDLHLGGAYGELGTRGFRINTHVSELVEFLRELRTRAAAQRVNSELVINGDFVDFLAEQDDNDNWHAFIDDEPSAVATFDRIAARDPGVFDELAALLRSGVPITLTLGNHDIELSLPAVRARLKARLGVTRTSPFQFVYDGEAYVVGNVLIEHGNRYDGWNVVDFDALRRCRSEYSRRLEPSPDAAFAPPAGSRLVEELMNPIKEDYPFIDLLKPENEAAIPLLLAMEPSFGKDVARLERSHQLQQDSSHRNPRAPARPNRPDNIRLTTTGTSNDSLADVLNRRLPPDAVARFLELTNTAERLSQQQAENISRGRISRALSLISMLFTGDWEKRLPWLLDAFRQLRDVFDPSAESATDCIDAAEELTAEGKFAAVVFGHTHHVRSITLTSGGTYLNTGSWTDSMRVPEAIISGPVAEATEALKVFFIAVRDKRLQEYLRFDPAFAHIRLRDGSVTSATVHPYTRGIVKAL